VIEVEILITKKKSTYYLEFFHHMAHSITRKFNLPNQVLYAKEKFSAYVLEAVLLLLSFGCLGLVAIDPSVRPMFLGLTKDVVLAYIARSVLRIPRV
jgi:hypothetical protein